jgi:hypothetical protein
VKRSCVFGLAPRPKALLADGGQADASAARSCAPEAPACDRQVAQLRRRAVDHGAVAALLARHLDLETTTVEFGKGRDRRGLGHVLKVGIAGPP